jgi:glycosyltransferase involved in cell wall biosynthesis
LRSRDKIETLVDALQPDLLFCPFTVPWNWRPGVPCVSIVYDLQHQAYPQFFTAEQRHNRQHHVELAVERSQCVVCISEYVRQTLLSNTDCPPERAVTIPLGLVHPPSAPDITILNRLALQPGKYLLYPANFWPHKNHRRLFEAIKQLASRPRLVCTGAPNPLMRKLRDEASTELVQFPGYVTEAELAALLDACAALVFPSLYEGFGLPILEAMARGKPVACSDLASLREVAGNCAVYFDPADPVSIATAIDDATSAPPSSLLVRRMREQAERLGNAELMASRYLALFRAL